MLKFILIIFIILFLVGRIVKFLLKHFILSSLQKQAQYSRKEPKPEKEGTIHIHRDAKKTNDPNSNAGEYIDFEVIK